MCNAAMHCEMATTNGSAVMNGDEAGVLTMRAQIAVLLDASINGIVLAVVANQ